MNKSSSFVRPRSLGSKAKKTRLWQAFVTALLLFAVPCAAIADGEEGVAPHKGWYLGVEGGVPFGFSTFSSFGHDKVHPGWTGGLFGGYRFNPVLSLEATAKYGQTTLTARGCCVERDYWLAADGVRYNAAVLGTDCWNYADLRSRVNVGQYGVRLNVNLLGLFNKTRNSRWSLALSPHVYAVSTKTSIQTLADGADCLKGSTKWHVGYGGDLQVGCHLARNLQLALYSGLTFVSGSKIDAMPKYLHKNNFFWESGLRLGFVFGKAKKSVVKAEPLPEPTVCPEETEAPTIAEPQKEQVTVTTTTEPAVLTFPDIYFGFSRKDITPSEQTKLDEIAATLRANPDVKVSIKGWCDTRGSKATNDRLSAERAKAVAQGLVERGISADRMETLGMGTDSQEPDAAKARRVTTEEKK